MVKYVHILFCVWSDLLKSKKHILTKLLVISIVNCGKVKFNFLSVLSVPFAAPSVTWPADRQLSSSTLCCNFVCP